MGKKLTRANTAKSQANQLTNKNFATGQPSKLTTNNNIDRIFKISICEQLDNNYCFKDLSKEALKSFHTFIDDTVGQKLTISVVEKMYLRTKGGAKQLVNGRELIHFGKDKKPFRIFGYYNNDGYFSITRIDPKHKTNKNS